jgi:CheY-like chemotaxis protein
MRKILVVEDDANQRFRLVEVLNTAIDDLEITEAPDGAIALEKLGKQSFSLVITDLKMPNLDGFGLIEAMKEQHSHTPIIVLSSMNITLFNQKMMGKGILQYLQKPVRAKTLIDKVNSVFSDIAKGFISGITIPSFLQLLGMENKTCTLHIQHGSDQGYLHMDKGMLINASFGDLEGVAAAHKIIAWMDADIKLLDLKPGIPWSIQESLSPLLLEALRLKDEEEAGHEVPPREEPAQESLELALEKVHKLFERSSTSMGYKGTLLFCPEHSSEHMVAHLLGSKPDLIPFGEEIFKQFLNCTNISKKYGKSMCMEQMLTTESMLLVLRYDDPFYLMSLATKKSNPASIRLEQRQLVKKIRKLLSPFF